MTSSTVGVKLLSALNVAVLLVARKKHINCTWPKEMKIKVKELAFITDQRDKTGSIGPHQNGLPDIPENKKLLKRQKRREEERKWLHEHKQRSPPDSLLLSNELIFVDEESDQEMADMEDEEESYEGSLGKSNVLSTSNKGTEYNKLEVDSTFDFPKLPS